MLKIKIFILFTFLGITSCYAQYVKSVSGEYIYHAPENVSLEEAKRTALNRAQIQALADEFGTVVSQHNATVLNNQNGKSNIGFTSLSGSDVKGEWLETIGTPQYEISYSQGMLVVKCTVRGKAREIISGKIDFKAKILKNGLEDKFESEAFKDGDDLFMSFQSPVKGFLAVYLVDDLQNAYCLLPYRSSKDGIVSVAANEKYILFSEKKAASLANANEVDEYTMTCEKASESNYIYIVFSPHSFVKALDNAVEGFPRELTFNDFQKWLTKNRTKDKDMQVEIKNITVTK